MARDRTIFTLNRDRVRRGILFLLKTRGHLIEEQSGWRSSRRRISKTSRQRRGMSTPTGWNYRARRRSRRELEKLAQIDDRMGQLRASMQVTDQKRRDLEAAMAKRVLEFKE